MKSLLVLVGLFLSGCGDEDPVLKAAREAADEEAAQRGEGLSSGGDDLNTRAGHPIDGGVAVAPGAGGAQKEGIPLEPQQPGIPEEPAPGDPTAPPVGKPGTPAEGVPKEPAQKVQTDEPMSRLRGQIRMKNYLHGGIRLDIFDGDHRSHAGQRPNLVRTVKLDKPGNFDVELPLSVGKIWLEASNDENQDGRPGPRDPSGRYKGNPITLEAEGINKIVIDVERNDPPPGSGGEEL